MSDGHAFRWSANSLCRCPFALKTATTDTDFGMNQAQNQYWSCTGVLG
jgi:hypothetical protein